MVLFFKFNKLNNDSNREFTLFLSVFNSHKNFLLKFIEKAVPWKESVKTYSALKNKSTNSSGPIIALESLVYIYLTLGFRTIKLYPVSVFKFLARLFNKLELLDDNILEEIESKKKLDWTKEFSEKVYKNIENHDIYITNLAKCTQIDARPLKDDYYKAYLKLFMKEMSIVKPKRIVLFGNQVSSIVLGEKIKVSEVRRKKFECNGYEMYSVFYPVGNGRFNMDKSIEDISYIKGLE